MFELFLSECRSYFRDKKHYVFIAGIALIPIIYAGMFIWAFWNPYDHTEHLPVAVVNEDCGAKLAGEKINLGKDLVDDLKHNDGFDWHFVSQKEAEKGFDRNRYYMTITIPKDFSEQVTTVMEKTPERARLYYKLNSGYNYIASIITDTGARKIKEKLDHEITKSFTENLFDKIDELSSGLKKAADGAGDLNDGAKKELDGLTALKSNLKKLGDAGIELEEGADALAAGAGDLKDGLDQAEAGTQTLYDATKNNAAKVQRLADGAGDLAKNIHALNSGIEKMVNGNQEMVDQLNGKPLSDAVKQLSAGLNQEYDGLRDLNEKLQAADDETAQLQSFLNGLQQLFTAIDQYNNSLPPEQQNKFQGVMDLKNALAQALNANTGNNDFIGQLDDLKSGVQQLTDGQKQLVAGFHELDVNLQKLAAGLTALQENIQKLPQATGQLAAGADQLAKGADALNGEWGTLVASIGKVNEAQHQLAEGAGTLEKNLAALKDGLKKMNHGQEQIADGSGQLASGMKDIQGGADELDKKLHDAYGKTADGHRANDNAAMFAEPVKAHKDAGPVDKYGVGFTPYFLSLGLYVGALLLSVIYDMKEPAIRPKNGVVWAFGKYLFLISVGLAQALIADAILLGVLGVDVSNPLAFIAFSILTSWTFMAIVQFLVSALGDRGRFLAIIILVLQLTTTGGTYPIELLPPALYNVHHWLPMNYSIAGFRNIVAGHQTDLLWHNVLVLAVFLVLMVAATTLLLTALHNKQKKQLDAAAEEATA
ncbi:YhgE/Pip domain-containing protein [Caenibacillus caldisaponilyticus]|uniref:YhgE/Pip domain-containing protein n=1 Tax=Caenibacillus caldisaponilyticus TaxID=1674942 RepID=UPI0009883CF6|nr:YhgE/Pip domain-containing protein [Caenibacillus caldisaponilyticus]